MRSLDNLCERITELIKIASKQEDNVIILFTNFSNLFNLLGWLYGITSSSLYEIFQLSIEMAWNCSLPHCVLVGSNPLKYSFRTKTLKNSLLKFELNWFWWAGDNVKLVQSGWRLLEYSFHNRNLNLLDQWWRSADLWRWIGLIFSSPKKAGQGVLLLIQYVNALCCSLAEEL